MDYLYAPWRGKYITKKNQNDPCPFCIQHAEHDDEKNFILKRHTSCTLLLNLYPYNPGHLLLIPHTHVANLTALTPAVRAEMMEALEQALHILQQTFHNPGANVGINLGEKVAGGSIPDHLHIHIVPRFHGDTNFLPVIAETKQISRDLKKIYTTLHEAFLHAPSL